MFNHKAKRPPDSAKRSQLFAFVACAFLLLLATPGCSLFPAKYDETTIEMMTRMKAFHLKFIDDFMVGTQRSKIEVNAACDQGDLRFRETIEYAKAISGGDTTRQNALEILQGQLQDNCKQLLQDAAPVSAGFAREMRAEVNDNYDSAIRGERARSGAN
jgi:hypothetical protein